MPGALIRNADLKYICRTVPLIVKTADSDFTRDWSVGDELQIPIAHHDGNYRADDALLNRLRESDRIAFTYGDTPNGSSADIAGVLSENRRVLGMMPHPERASDEALGGTDGRAMFRTLTSALISA